METVVRGNRVAVLTGDYMLANATKNLVKLNNSRVSDLMSKSLRDFVEGEYMNMKMREEIESGNWFHILDNWVRITALKSCSLIANGCQAMAHLTANCQTLEESFYKFGHNIAYAWNVTEELENFHRLRIQNKSKANNELMFSLPMLLHFKSNPDLKDTVNSFDNIKSFIENVSQVLGNGSNETGSAFARVGCRSSRNMCCLALTPTTNSQLQSATRLLDKRWNIDQWPVVIGSAVSGHSLAYHLPAIIDIILIGKFLM